MDKATRRGGDTGKGNRKAADWPWNRNPTLFQLTTKALRIHHVLVKHGQPITFQRLAHILLKARHIMTTPYLTITHDIATD